VLALGGLAAGGLSSAGGGVLAGGGSEEIASSFQLVPSPSPAGDRFGKRLQRCTV